MKNSFIFNFVNDHLVLVLFVAFFLMVIGVVVIFSRGAKTLEELTKDVPTEKNEISTKQTREDKR